MPPETEQKFYIKMRILDKQQKRDFFQDLEVTASSEDEAKLFAFYGIRKIWDSKKYEFAISSIREGLILLL